MRAHPIFSGAFWVGLMSLAAVEEARAQLLSTSIYGYAQVDDQPNPAESVRKEFSAISGVGAALSDNREAELSLTFLPGVNAAERGGASAAAAAFAEYGFVRAESQAGAGYSQFFYVPNGLGGSDLQPPHPNRYKPAALSQTTAASLDKLTISSTAAAANAPRDFVFSFELLANRVASYGDNGNTGTLDDATVAKTAYSGPQYSGLYTTLGQYLNPTSRVSVTLVDTANPGVPVAQRVLQSRVGAWFFTSMKTDLTASLLVGHTYDLEFRIDTTTRSDGGTQHPEWSPDTTRERNRAIDAQVLASSRLKIKPANAADRFVAISGATYGDAPVSPSPGAVAPPTLKLKTPKRIVTTVGQETVRGTTSGNASRVEARFGSSGPWRRVQGVAAWRYKASLRKGKNVLNFVAVGPGGRSAPAKVTVILR